ncbi:MAG TPA: hypothetical protein GXZ32_00855 [Clostridiales bacterium]|nr:hypothetical protein [Clostridiales bacterium]
MYNSIRDIRQKTHDGYRVILEIPEKDYINIYENIDRETASKVMANYLRYRNDDARPTNINIGRNKNRRIVNITVDLKILGNQKTDHNP